MRSSNLLCLAGAPTTTIFSGLKFVVGLFFLNDIIVDAVDATKWHMKPSFPVVEITDCGSQMPSYPRSWRRRGVFPESPLPDDPFEGTVVKDSMWMAWDYWGSHASPRLGSGLVKIADFSIKRT